MMRMHGPVHPVLEGAMSDEEDLMPQPLMTTAIWSLAAVVGAAFLLSFSTFLLSFSIEQTFNGEVVAFKDYGAIGGGGLALLLAAVALKDVFSPLAGNQKFPRLGVVGVLSALAVCLVVYGLGLFV